MCLQYSMVQLFFYHIKYATVLCIGGVVVSIFHRNIKSNSNSRTRRRLISLMCTEISVVYIHIDYYDCAGHLISDALTNVPRCLVLV